MRAGPVRASFLTSAMWFSLHEIRALDCYSLPVTRSHGNTSVFLESQTRLAGIDPEMRQKYRISQRIRLDCVSEANHNLNRLLDKPGLLIGGRKIRKSKA